MITIPAELWENLSQTLQPVKQILKSNDHRYTKLAQVRLHKAPKLKTDRKLGNT